MKQKNITREQKKQVNRFLQQIYGFPFKAGGAYLCGAGFEKQGLYTSVYTLQKQALRRIQHSGAAYISLNIFKPRQGHCRRAEKHLWRFNHIVIDIDSRIFLWDYEAVEQELERQIRWYGTYGDAPMPNAIVFTGSGGCHLYYIFEDLPNGKGGRMAEGIQAVKMQLLARWVQIEKTLQDEGLYFHVDTQAIDASRVFRIPGSIHPDTGRMCWMKPLQSTPYGYKEFCRCLSDVPWKGDYAVANARRDIERARFGYGRKDWRSEPYAMTKQFLGAKRLRELLRLAHTGWGFQDCRELAAHFAWIWGRDAELSEDEIRDKLRELNACFYQPFSYSISGRSNWDGRPEGKALCFLHLRPAAFHKGDTQVHLLGDLPDFLSRQHQRRDPFFMQLCFPGTVFVFPRTPAGKIPFRAIQP